jgi:hypothetical protein
MGRLLALILGGLALALYVPPFFFEDPVPVEASGVAKVVPHNDFDQVFVDALGAPFTHKLKTHGAGVFAGLALILFAVRGKD